MKKYYKALLYFIFGLILVIASYMIIINIYHYKALSVGITVSENDVILYKKNINEIEHILNDTHNTSNEIIALKNNFNILKDDGVFRLMPKTRLEFHDLYELNSYFLNRIINDYWVVCLKETNSDKNKDEMISILINNADSIGSRLVLNGTTLYDGISQNRIEDDYKMILNNYVSFSNIVLSEIGGYNEDSK